MLFDVGGFTVCNMRKSDDNFITIDFVANQLSRDNENEIVLKEAFDDETVKEYLQTGIVDFWHGSDLSPKNKFYSDIEDAEIDLKNKLNSQIIGKPIAFRWENGLPVVTAQLTAKHPSVLAMMPHLEAGNPVYAASIAGHKYVYRTKDANGKEIRVVPKIKWTKTAIAPCNSVQNTGTGINGVNVRLVKMSKGQSLDISYENIMSFAGSHRNIMLNEETLVKALGAPETIADLYGAGAGAMTKQSIETKVKDDSFTFDEAKDLLQLVLDYSKNPQAMPQTKTAFFAAFENKKQFAEKSYRLLQKFFNK